MAIFAFIAAGALTHFVLQGRGRRAKLAALKYQVLRGA
jgi:hypothetical protein